jgi:general secretion pathway protein C
MKRAPLIASFILFLALCATLAWWAMQFLTPTQRSAATPMQATSVEPVLEAAAGLFGGAPDAATPVGNMQISGTIAAANAADSVVILSVAGKPPQAIRVGKEIAPGIALQEVHNNHVLISEHGSVKRIELPKARSKPQ